MSFDCVIDVEYSRMCVFTAGAPMVVIGLDFFSFKFPITVLYSLKLPFMSGPCLTQCNLIIMPYGALLAMSWVVPAPCRVPVESILPGEIF